MLYLYLSLYLAFEYLTFTKIEICTFWRKWLIPFHAIWGLYCYSSVFCLVCDTNPLSIEPLGSTQIIWKKVFFDHPHLLTQPNDIEPTETDNFFLVEKFPSTKGLIKGLWPLTTHPMIRRPSPVPGNGRCVIIKYTKTGRVDVAGKSAWITPSLEENSSFQTWFRQILDYISQRSLECICCISTVFDGHVWHPSLTFSCWHHWKFPAKHHSKFRKSNDLGGILMALLDANDVENTKLCL